MALSFAGAQRDYVAEALQARGVRCFYDADEQIELWGKYLAEELPAIYGEQAAAVVVFVSAEYAARDWTRLERRAALGRAVRERREYVLPARFDDTPLPTRDLSDQDAAAGLREFLDGRAHAEGPYRLFGQAAGRLQQPGAAARRERACPPGPPVRDGAQRGDETRVFTTSRGWAWHCRGTWARLPGRPPFSGHRQGGSAHDFTAGP